MMTADHHTGRLRLGFTTVRRAFLAVALALAFLWPAPPARAAGGYLAVACLRRNAGQCGVINEKGAWVVAPSFNQIGDFAPNGRAVAAKGRRPGIIDTRGEWVIPPVYDRLDGEWSAGLIKVGRSGAGGWRYGLVDESGKVVLEPSLREINLFGPNHLAGACERKERCGFIDTRGTWVVPPVFAQVEEFAENGLAPARLLGEDLWGYINASGEFVIPQAYEMAFPFEGDRAKVVADGLYSLINSKGQPVGKNKFATLGDFDSGGLAPAQEEIDGLYGLVNSLKGAWVVPPRFERLFSFNGGNLAPAQEDGLFGFINRKGQWAIKPAFNNVEDFEIRGSRAPAARSGGWGLIDAAGNWVVQPDHLLLINAGGVQGPLQVFAENGLWGLMDVNGRWIMEPTLNASPYFAANGISEARVDELYGFINRLGMWVVKPSFQQVGAFKPVPAVPPALTLPEQATGTPPAKDAAQSRIARNGGPKAEEGAPAKPRRERPQESSTRLAVPEPSPNPAEPKPARAPDRPKPAEPLVSPPTGYIHPEGPVRRNRPAPSRPAAPQPVPPEQAETAKPPEPPASPEEAGPVSAAAGDPSPVVPGSPAPDSPAPAPASPETASAPSPLAEAAAPGPESASAPEAEATP